jgi:hypothetical protein
VVTVVGVGEGAEVVGDGARWSEVGWGVVVVVMGEGSGMRWLSEVREASQCRRTHTPREKKRGSIHNTPQNDKAYPFGCNKEIGAMDICDLTSISVHIHKFM